MKYSDLIGKFANDVHLDAEQEIRLVLVDKNGTVTQLDLSAYNVQRLRDTTVIVVESADVTPDTIKAVAQSRGRLV